MIGKTILHYKITEKLGEGGMGVVYKAEDTKLKRDVAIKFLPRQIAASEEERARFKIEAQAAAALNHPNIATIYAIEEVDDEMFIVMEYIEGKELRQVVETHNYASLPMDEILDYATQMAFGLQAAHEKGVVHRDIKSANIMVTGKGQIKIMDFGLAKVRGGPQFTTVGATLGTTAYMSPEQARGEGVDHRTDIFSLGVVLYEMLTGEMPFKGDYEQAVIYSLLNEEPEPILALQPDVPKDLAELVHNCLQKEPEQRYASTSELLNALQGETKRLQTTSSKSRWPRQFASIAAVIAALTIGWFSYFSFFKQSKSKERVPIAVVDFVNQTNEPELDGLSGMLITALEQSRRLGVMSRARMFDEFKQMDRTDLHFVDEATGREIAKRANLSALAVATIRKFGQLYTVDFKVINPQTGERIFSTKVEGKGQESIPGLLDELSDKTRVDLIEQDTIILTNRRGVADITTTNLEAYQHYFKGQEFIDKLDFDSAKTEFRQAIAMDTTFALAYYRLSYSMGWYFEQLATEPLQKALQYIDRIPEKERFLVRAEERRHAQGMAAGVSILKEMEKRYPHDKEMLYNIADYSFHSGDFVTAVAYFDKLLEIASNHQRTQFHYGAALMGMYTDPVFVKKDFRAALARVIREREKQPDLPELTTAIATLYAYLGDYQKAEDEIMIYLAQATTPQAKQQGRLWLTSLLPYTGQYERALGLLDTSIEEAFTSADTATAVLHLVIKGMMSGVGLNSSENANVALERLLVFKDRTDVPYLKSALADLAVVSARRALAFEFLEQARDPAASAIVLSITGQCNQAAPMIEALKEGQNFPAFLKLWLFYLFAECRFEEGDLTSAEQHAKAALEVYHPLDIFTRGAYYPKTLFLLGKINEAKGDAPAARKYYQQLLDLWKNADDDIPDLLEAKQRLARLERALVK